MCQSLNPPPVHCMSWKDSTKQSTPRWCQATVIVRGEHHKTYPIRIQQTSVFGKFRFLANHDWKNHKMSPTGRGKKNHKHCRSPWNRQKIQKTNKGLWIMKLIVFQVFFPKNGWCSASSWLSWLSFDVVTAWFNQAGYIGYSYAKVKSP